MDIFDRNNLILLVLAIMFHYPASSGYVWDDTLLIELNPWKNSLHNLRFVWENSLWSGIPGEHVDHWYRPLMGTHILLDQWLFGNALSPKQWISLAWFTGGMILLNGWLQSVLGLSRNQSLWIVGLLTLHPYSLELTQFIAARNDTMALTFALGIPFIIQRPPTLVHHIGVALLMFCTLCSKESGLMWVCIFMLPIYTEVPKYWSSLLSGFTIWMVLKSNASLETLRFSLEWLPILETWTHSGTWWLITSTPLQPTPDTASFIGLAVAIFMVVCAQNRSSRMGLLIFVVGGLLASIAAEQSTTLGFRYLWIPMFGQVLWLVSILPKIRLRVLVVPFVLMGVQTLQEREHWIDNTTFWENGYQNHPNQHTACGSFMTLRDQPFLAVDRLEVSIVRPPKLHCCAQASRYPLEIGDMPLAISIGTKAIENGCPKIPELLAPMAMAAAVLGDWKRCNGYLDDYSTDPFGYKPLLETAYGLQHDDDAALIRWTTPENPLLPDTTVSERQVMLKGQAEVLLQKIQSYTQSE